MDSAGTATEANNIYMDTTKAKVGELKAAFQELSSDFISSNFTKGAVEGLKGIVEAIDKIVETVGSLGTILAGLGLAKVIKNVLNPKSWVAFMAEVGMVKDVPLWRYEPRLWVSVLK